MAIHVDPRKHELLEARIQGNNDFKQTSSYNSQFVTNGKSMTNKPLQCKVDLEKRPFLDLNDNSASSPSSNIHHNQNMTLGPQRVSPSDQENTSSSSMGPSDLVDRSSQPRKPSGDTSTSRHATGTPTTPNLSSSVPNNVEAKTLHDSAVSKEITTPKASTSRRKRRGANEDGSSHPKKVHCREKGTKRIDEVFKSKSESSPNRSSMNPLSMLHASNENQRSGQGSPATAKASFIDLTNNHLASTLLKSKDINHSELEYASYADQLHSVSPKSPAADNKNYVGVQTEICIPLVPQTDPNSALNLERLQRKVSELERDSELANERVVRYQDQQSKSREVIKNLLIEKSLLERRTTRQKVMEDRLRLGQFVTQRQGVHFEEKWIEGSRFKELDKRRKHIESIREEIERKKKQWNKRKPTSLSDSSKKSSKNIADSSSVTVNAASGREATAQSATGNNNADSNDDSVVSIEGFYEQAEIYDIRKQLLSKEDKELQNELERLDRERNLHIREIKRIANEDASRFKNHPVLSDRYLLLNLLGKGGFSEVHKGFDLIENRYVACKIHQLNPAWPKEKKDNYIRHALREIEIHKNLNHNRIVKVFDVFDIDHDAFCTVLEYSEGNDLDFFLKQNKVIPEREAKSIVVQVLSALRYLNERKPPIIHYDLKPGNILLGSGEKSGEIKITDFGLSKVMDEAYAPDVGMDLTSQGAGTYWYLPPECFETHGDEPPKINSKVDIWSVGVIFYQCLFGKKPFGHNMSQADILHQNTILQARNINFPSVPKVSEGAKEFIRRCCTYKKDIRPDVFQLSNDDYLKPKAQLKHHLDLSSLPAPTGVPHHGASREVSSTTGPGASQPPNSALSNNNSNSQPYVPNVAGGISSLPPAPS